MWLRVVGWERAWVKQLAGSAAAAQGVFSEAALAWQSTDQVATNCFPCLPLPSLCDMLSLPSHTHTYL